MKPKYTMTALLFLAIFTLFSASTSFAQDSMKKDETMKKDAMMKSDDMMDDKRPIVAIIAAEWCPYCKRIDPIVKDVMATYSEKLNFVMFDVTNEKTTAAAMQTAKKLGLTDFFSEYKSKTSTVAVLKDNKIVYKTSNNGKKEDYIKAFEKVLK